MYVNQFRLETKASRLRVVELWLAGPPNSLTDTDAVLRHRTVHPVPRLGDRPKNRIRPREGGGSSDDALRTPDILVDDALGGAVPGRRLAGSLLNLSSGCRAWWRQMNSSELSSRHPESGLGRASRDRGWPPWSPAWGAAGPRALATREDSDSPPSHHGRQRARTKYQHNPHLTSTPDTSWIGVAGFSASRASSEPDN